MDGEVLTEVPANLQKLVQMVVRGFYTTEDMLIVDILVRKLCLSEDNICNLLQFERKMLRQRINTLRTDKLLQTKNKMITMEDGKSQREQYYFINYKSFVNVVKYKLDHIRKKLEMEERDQTSRASFVCQNCQRTYTDLEADQLLDLESGQLKCIICRTEVQEDMVATPRSDSRHQLTRFNEQLEPLFTLLKEVENIKLSAEFSDPNPQDPNQGKKNSAGRGNKNGDDSRAWSGEATKRQGFHVEGSIDVNINKEELVEETLKPKEAPVWLSQTSSFITPKITSTDEENAEATANSGVVGGGGGGGGSSSSSSSAITETVSKHQHVETAAKSDVLSLLQAHEPKSKSNADQNSDSDDSVEELPAKPAIMAPITYNEDSLEGMLDSDDGSGDDSQNVPVILVGGERIAISAVDNSVIARMTQQEKNIYINVYQEYFAGMDDL